MAQSVKFGPVDLTPGVSRGNAWALMWGAFFIVGLLAFVSISAPYVLTVYLNVPESEQGTIIGDLVFWAEVTQILIFGAVGIATDRFGRNSLCAIGLITMGVTYALFPFAGSVGELTAFRVAYAVGVGIAAGTLATVVADYPQEKSRGKLLAIWGLLNGIGIVVITAVLGNLPDRLVEAGYNDIAAGRYQHAAAAVGCLLTAAVLGLGLKKGTPDASEQRPTVWDLVRSGVREGRNPRIALSYASAFVSRGDLAILGTFTILWGKNFAMSQGVEPAEALSVGTFVFVTAQLAALASAPLLGFMLDRVNRVTGIIVSMGLATAGYLATMFVDDPTARAAIPVIVLLGIGQIAAFLGSATLVGQEAPPETRGSVIGAFNSCGAIGILIVSIVGGRLFDQVGPSAPFVLVGVLNGLVFLGAIVVRLKSPGAASA